MADKCRPTEENEGASVATQLSIVPYDALQLDTVEETVQSALVIAKGNIDILILNAGIYQLKPALQTTMSETRDILRVNFEAPVALATTLIHMNQWKTRRHGHIVVVTSLVARGAQSLTSSYAASKAALRNYMFTLSTEESSWLRVDVALPGATDTGLWNSLSSNTTVERAPEYVKMSPRRVAHLILTGASGPFWLFYETYITKPIGLIWIYLSIYTPTLFHLFIHIVGYIRVQLWNVHGSDTLDMTTLLSSIAKLLFTGRVI